MTAAKNRGLGKGLGALFSEVELNSVFPGDEELNSVQDSDNESENRIRMIDIHQIRPNPDQPRKVFSEEGIQELADSIEEHGIIQPIMLIPSGQGYEIVAGERRWRAAQKAKLKKVPCIIRNVSEREKMLFALIENVQREGLNPLEEAEAFQKMSDAYGLTQTDIAKGVGKSRPYIANAVRLLKLPEPIKALVQEEKLTSGHVRALVTMKDEKKQMLLAKRAAEEGWSVRQMEQSAGEERDGKKKRPQPRKKSREITDIEEELKAILGTRVTLELKAKRGKIGIEYYSREELERLIDLLRTLK